ncbi:hypothetical protein DFA_11623 [Cavenderia fasciculata]|uniref:Transmembrane protein n=1 Tax=Cavenderia fasciculata TaxID=261658 RepID=F4QDR5_CACFS|nr:uncharacterized protein DFA_11623 [Cavenderia fasciculata]EGG13862.1 hypothetical protein DFA_11623 [Cavenderia fasciculata]|eukprot:XP_004350570.1 hypothetical protein DFA_11623 [Cavenderia fasciculata]
MGGGFNVVEKKSVDRNDEGDDDGIPPFAYYAPLSSRLSTNYVGYAGWSTSWYSIIGFIVFLFWTRVICEALRSESTPVISDRTLIHPSSGVDGEI